MNPIALQALLDARRRLVKALPEPSRRFWTDAEVARLRALYPDTPMPDLVRTFNRPDHAIYNKAHALGLARSAEYLASEHACRLRREDSPGLEYRFKPGQDPWNKGLKGLQIGGEATQFRKGNKPHTWQPVGTERVTEDGIRQRKVCDDGPSYRRWKSVHSLLWEEAHGEIPPGHLVVFKDRNPKNIELDNLELVSRAENMRRNTIHRYPPELKSTIRQLSKLKRAISEAASEKQDDRSA
ncbi:HNH endonuclease signature motif containing protein [Pseudomonas guariconensis]|uniref:HNH endonuclease signature motif containing protein n=1 Tax=Pseudomonas guariconensis TaxID=1288410 RepID=UPI002D1E575C|nr:HNH endonuclease signature motif containing protein [Pseudomonas guariconensis]MEB3843481.1 HNH endonuclease [Pseudomonas guariconensis]MEB3876349.1 HNH endonuclease [Pseudomonas guariconensis]MEB3881322.1 HNH endonuclease [Pseudomonas guariconensis]MEB3898103.1 HNH endonuclease [Pseudomonas guariconensis]